MMYDRALETGTTNGAGSDSSSGPASNFLRAGQSLVGSVIAVLQTRLELLSTEIEEEWLRITGLIMIGLSALFCVGVAIMLVVTLIVAAFWDSYRLLSIGVLASAFAIAAWIFWRSLVLRYQSKPRLFAATLDELGKDQAAISGAPQ
jgi:uncharacterized membrane protein YqjE